MQEGVRQECKKEKEDRKWGCVSLIVSMGMNELFPCVSRRCLPFVFTLWDEKPHLDEELRRKFRHAGANNIDTKLDAEEE
jgi:hypothetical protein